MTMISLLPADTYTVVNKSIITEDDKKNIISLYEPIIGPLAVCLYFTLIRDLSILEIISKDYTHHHLMTMMKSSIDTIRQARESLEGVGLLKSYYKEGEPNSYVYELYSPLSPKEFLSSPIFNVTLYNNVGKTEYEQIKSEYELPKIDLKDYQDITSSLNKTYRSTSINEIIDAKEKNNLNIKLDSNIDFDLLISSLPKGLIKESDIDRAIEYQKAHRGVKLGEVFHILKVCDDQALLNTIGEATGYKPVQLDPVLNFPFTQYISIDIVKQHKVIPFVSSVLFSMHQSYPSK